MNRPLCSVCSEREAGTHARGICNRCYHRQWWAAHPGTKYPSAQGWRQRNPDLRAISNRKSARKWMEKNPERAALSNRTSLLVQAAIRKGILTRPSHCEQCGLEKVVQGAHADYSRPLDVRWLCHLCHRNWDHAEPKTLVAVRSVS